MRYIIAISVALLFRQVDPTEADISSTNAINQTSAERAQVRLLLTHCQNKHDLVENLGFVDSAQELAKTVLGLVGMKFNRADYRAAVEDHNLADYAVTQYQESLQHPLQSSQVTPPGVTPIPALVALDENSRALTYVQSLELARQTFQTVLYPVRLVPGYGTTALLSAVPADAARLAADAIAYAELRIPAEDTASIIAYKHILLWTHFRYQAATEGVISNTTLVAFLSTLNEFEAALSFTADPYTGVNQFVPCGI